MLISFLVGDRRRHPGTTAGCSGERPRVSLLASGVGLVVAALLLVPAQLAPAVGAFVVMGLSVAGVVPTVLVAATRLVPGDSGGVAGGMMAASNAGFILCPPLLGWLAELFASWHLAALLCVGLSGLGALIMVRGVPCPLNGERGRSWSPRRTIRTSRNWRPTPRICIATQE